MIITIRDATTGELDTGTYAIKYQPVDQPYDTGAITASQLPSLSNYKPDEDGNTEQAYDIYKDGTKIGRIWGPDLLPDIGV